MHFPVNRRGSRTLFGWCRGWICERNNEGFCCVCFPHSWTEHKKSLCWDINGTLSFRAFCAALMETIKPKERLINTLNTKDHFAYPYRVSVHPLVKWIRAACRWAFGGAWTSGQFWCSLWLSLAIESRQFPSEALSLNRGQVSFANVFGRQGKTTTPESSSGKCLKAECERRHGRGSRDRELSSLRSFGYHYSSKSC